MGMLFERAAWRTFQGLPQSRRQKKNQLDEHEVVHIFGILQEISSAYRFLRTQMMKRARASGIDHNNDRTTDHFRRANVGSGPIKTIQDLHSTTTSRTRARSSTQTGELQKVFDDSYSLVTRGKCTGSKAGFGKRQNLSSRHSRTNISVIKFVRNGTALALT